MRHAQRSRCIRHAVLFGLPVTLQWPDTGGGRRLGVHLQSISAPGSSRVAASRAQVVMLDSVRCLMSVVMASPSERPIVTADGERRGPTSLRRQSGSKRKVRVHRISSRYPTVEVRTRMDSYGTGVRSPAAAITVANSNAAGVDLCGAGDDFYGGGSGDTHTVAGGSSSSSSSSSSSASTSTSTSASDTAAGCSSVSDTDFYYEDRTDDAGVHTTVIELRAEHVDRTETVQEEFRDSLTPNYDENDDDHNHHQLQSRHVRRRTVEVVTKHRHVLSESCRVKVENLRYASAHRLYLIL